MERQVRCLPYEFLFEVPFVTASAATLDLTRRRCAYRMSVFLMGLGRATYRASPAADRETYWLHVHHETPAVSSCPPRVANPVNLQVRSSALVSVWPYWTGQNN